MWMVNIRSMSKAGVVSVFRFRFDCVAGLSPILTMGYAHCCTQDFVPESD